MSNSKKKPASSEKIQPAAKPTSAESASRSKRSSLAVKVSGSVAPAAATTKQKKIAADRAVANPTRIVAYVDVGLGNELYIRGEGPGMSWEKGIHMSCTAAACWEWVGGNATATFSFKLLLNDITWAHGENGEAHPGKTTVARPAF